MSLLSLIQPGYIHPSLYPLISPVFLWMHSLTLSDSGYSFLTHSIAAAEVLVLTVELA